MQKTACKLDKNSFGLQQGRSLQCSSLELKKLATLLFANFRTTDRNKYGLFI
ncbi:hypothetical protein [Scytonema sp. NUACC26]|uniref:hypothetical protein n=1 Tax=Scytonema sp. NUACC26 TaxID=3140176 RepID=UPI0038B2991E